MTRIPVFDLHIRPMFRVIDHDHMLQRNFDLDDYDTVRSAADLILDHLRGSSPMPTAATGGPWPDEWIALFERWMEHFHRLEPNAGQRYTLASAFGKYRLSCTTSLPHFGARTWLDLRGVRDGSRLYHLVLERAVPEPPTFETEVTLRETFDADADPAGVWVVDADGERFVTFPTS